jgi:hypothetical protein
MFRCRENSPRRTGVTPSALTPRHYPPLAADHTGTPGIGARPANCKHGHGQTCDAYSTAGRSFRHRHAGEHCPRACRCRREAGVTQRPAHSPAGAGVPERPRDAESHIRTPTRHRLHALSPGRSAKQWPGQTSRPRYQDRASVSPPSRQAASKGLTASAGADGKSVKQEDRTREYASS